MYLYAHRGTQRFGVSRRELQLLLPNVSLAADGSPPEGWAAYEPTDPPDADIEHDVVEVYPVGGKQTWQLVPADPEVVAERRQDAEREKRDAERAMAFEVAVEFMAKRMALDPEVPVQERRSLALVYPEAKSGESVRAGEIRRVDEALYEADEDVVVDDQARPDRDPVRWHKVMDARSEAPPMDRELLEGAAR